MYFKGSPGQILFCQRYKSYDKSETINMYKNYKIKTSDLKKGGGSLPVK